MPTRSKKRRFTPEYLNDLRPKRTRYEMGDSECSGLAVRVEPTGRKSLYAMYKVHGGHHDPTKLGKTGRRLASPQRRVRLGRWRAELGTTELNNTLEDARERTRRYVDEARNGIDPRDELTTHRANTLAAVAKRYMDTSCREYKTVDKIESLFRNHINPTLGALPIQEVSAKPIGGLLDDYIAQGKVGTAREIRKVLTALFNWAKERELVVYNPAAGLRRNDLKQKKVEGYSLLDHELKAVWAAAHELGYPYGHLYKLLILSGQRYSDWARASWIEVESDRLKIPAARYKTGHKTGHGHSVPLVEHISVVVRELLFREKGEWLFWNANLTGPAVTKNTAERKLRPLALLRLREQTKNSDATLHHFRVHDFRHTCETRMSRLGINEEVRRAVLGHEQRGMSNQYGDYDFWNEKVNALRQYSKHVIEILR